MARRGKLKIIVNAALALVLAGVGAAVIFYYVHSRETVSAMQDALRALEMNDIDKAIALFAKVLAKDADNEMAVVKLAEIYDSQGNWPLSSYFWRNAYRLNNLNDEYESKFILSAQRGRDLKRLADYLENKRGGLELDEQILKAYCHLMQNPPKKGIELWNKLLKETPEAESRPYGQLIRWTHFVSDDTFDQVFKELDSLSKSDNEFIAQEALIALANTYAMARLQDKEEECLKLLTDRNFYVGAPRLGQLYSNRRKYVEAIDIFGRYLEKFTSDKMAIALGEILVFTSQHDKLSALAAKWSEKSGKSSIMAAYYLEALNALTRHDLEAMSASVRPIHGKINTPLAVFMNIYADVLSNNTVQLETDLRQFAKFPPFFDLRQRVHTLVVLYLQDRVKAGADAKDLLHLAETLQEVKFDSVEDTMPILISLIGKLQNNTLSEWDVKDALVKLPDNAVCG